MNSFFENHISNLQIKYETANFAYYRSRSSNYHAIVVKGMGLYENGDFIDDQELILTDFYAQFPNEDISFLEVNELDFFPNVVCVIDFQPIFNEWFINQQYEDLNDVDNLFLKQETGVYPKIKYALAA